MQRTKISATFTVEIDQLERLSEVAARARINRSVIVREAIDWALKRYEQKAAKVEAGEEVGRGGEVAEVALARRP
jgi:predicted transcriptional regulator